MKPIDREKFTEWLRGKEPFSIVGVAYEPYCCPLARYLNEGELAKRFHIEVGVIRDTKTGEMRATEPWEEEFAVAVDNLVIYGEPETVNILAQQALDILEDIPYEAD